MYDFYGVELPDDEKETNKEEQVNEDVLKEYAKNRYLEMLKIPHKDDDILIEDEFGRIRWVKQGSDDHMRNIGSSYRIRQELQGKSYSTPATKQKMSRIYSFMLIKEIDAARVKMTWENQLNKREREFFTEIDVLK